jgi:hypothetical protein
LPVIDGEVEAGDRRPVIDEDEVVGMMMRCRGMRGDGEDGMVGGVEELFTSSWAFW